MVSLNLKSPTSTPLRILIEKDRDREMNHTQKNNEEDEEINNLLLSLMEGYSDSVIPPLSELPPLHEADQTAAIQNKSSRKRCRDGDYKEVPEIVKGERKRRNKMGENFMVLQNMIPSILPKASRDRIIDETISHIEFLKDEIKRLEEKISSSAMGAKGKMSMYSNWNSSIDITASSNVVCFGIQTFARQRKMTEIFMVFQRHGAEVLASNLVVDHGQLALTVTAFVNGNKDQAIKNIKRDILAL